MGASVPATSTWARFRASRARHHRGRLGAEVIVEEIMELRRTYTLHVETVSAAEENEFFPLPRSVRPEDAPRVDAWRVYTDVAADELVRIPQRLCIGEGSPTRASPRAW